MVRARVVHIGLGELELPPERFVPDKPDWFCVKCIVYFGNTAGEGTNYHQLYLCSPTWLADNLPADAVLRGQGVLIMNEYDGMLLREAVESFAQACTAADVEHLYRKLERFGFSEFEDYNEVQLPQFFIDPLHQRETL